MNILMFSINPLYPDQVMGGAPKHLQHVAIHLAELGHDVVVLCTRPAGGGEPFSWHERVRVRPTLPFKQPFPQPYDTPAYHLGAILQDVTRHLATAERFYIHDGELLFPYLYQQVPTVVSLRDSVYPETQLGAFLFQGDVLITVSEHSRQYYLETAGRFFPQLAERTLLIRNGFDWQVFRPTQPGEILAMLPFEPDKHTVILHPHRPEESKGLRQTMAVADLLRRQYGLANLRVLVPRWLDSEQSPALRGYYESVRQELQQRGLTEVFVFHDWVPQRLMPQYYSLGALTLALGHFVEAFGNAVYESLGCGTPAIAARVAAHRELVPDEFLDKVHYGDVEAAAELAAAIIREGRRTSPQAMAYLHQHLDRERQVQAYADAILNAQRRGPLTFRVPTFHDNTRYRLAPWCYRWPGGIYHDFLAQHQRLPQLETLLDAHPSGFSPSDAALYGVSTAAIDEWTRQGYLVPVL